VGYVLKRSVTEELLLAVRAAHRGDIYLSPAISRSVVGPLLRPHPVVEASGFAQLTRREREVLQLIAKGHTNRSIAKALSVSIKTVENHRAHLMSKLGIHDVAGLTRVAIKHGLVFLDD
jgi:DNA-binding NarL/FixJ family response regulator